MISNPGLDDGGVKELAAEGYFDGIIDLATHELADEQMQLYCRGREGSK
jgi:hypothetical protein